MSVNSLYSLLNTTDNLHDPVPILNDRNVAYGLVITLLTIASICAGTRIYVRLFITRCFGSDDVFILLSMVAGTVHAISVLVGFNEGLGEHFLYIATDVEQTIRFIKTSYVETACYPTATALIKIAILLQFRRIFNQSSARYRLATECMIVLTALWGVSVSFISWFPAFPVDAFWDLRNTSAVRYGIASLEPASFTATYVTITATNMILDLLILTIPVPYYMKSALTWKSRASLLGLFLLGSVINFISLYRLISVIETQAGTYPTLDPSFYGCTPTVLASLEVSLAATAASIPVFWPIIQQNLGNIFVTYEVTVREEHKEDGGVGGDESQQRRRNSSSRLRDTDPNHMWVPHDVPMAYLSTEITNKYNWKTGAEEDKESLVKPSASTGSNSLKRSLSSAKVRAGGSAV